MKALILDAGNSQVKLFAWAGTGQSPRLGEVMPPLLDLVQRWETPRRGGNFPELAAAVQKAWERGGRPPLVVTSVIPEIDGLLKNSVEGVRVVDHRLEMPFSSLVEDPAAVGSDRYCNMAAAVGAGLANALVVDVGTATTFDLLVDGVFIGGLIAPGPELALNCLGRQAARLGPVPFQPAPLAAAAGTVQAMARGGWNTGIGGIQWCIDGLLKEYGPRAVILTGGLGRHLAAAGRFLDPHFTLRGAAVLGGLLSE